MDPSVKLISYTPDALALLIYTKNTRLRGGETMESIAAWPKEKLLAHLGYMRDTIKSSWEFVDFVFEIKGVDRAFTHQLVRTRHGSYAQQSQRTVDMRDANYTDIGNDLYDLTVLDSLDTYKRLVNQGVPIQDARGILPTCIETEIIAKFNLRTLHEMAQVRLCTRAQGLYQAVFKLIKAAVVEVYPWAADFIKVACAWNGVCIFPRYKECPIQQFTKKATTEELETIETVWRNTEHVAVPRAVNGRTM